MHVEDHLSLVELKRLARSEQDARFSRRLQMVVLAVEGYTAPAIARSLSCSRRTCQQWVQRYNAEGLVGLQDKPGRGKAPLLTAEEQLQLKQRIDAGPTTEDGVCALRGKDIQRILAEEFGKVRSLDAVYYLLHQLGYSSLVPRPQHRKADREAQADFKKVPREADSNSSATTGQTLASVLPRRSSVWPARNNYSRLGADRFTPLCGTSNTIRLSLGDRHGLSRNRPSRRALESATEYGRDQHLLGAIFPVAVRR